MLKYTAALLIIMCAVLPAQAAYAPGSAPFINTWLVLGTFDNTSNTKMNTGIATEKPRTGMTSNGKEWRYFDDRLFSRNYDDYQDLYSYFHTKQRESIANKTVYMHVYVWIPKVQDTQLRVGAHTEWEAWVNGTAVGKSAGVVCTKDATSTPVNLDKGWNRMLIRVANTEETCLGLYARLCDQDGNALPGLIYSVNGPLFELKITTQSFNAFVSGDMPVAFKEWPYVGLTVPYIDITNRRTPNLAALNKNWAQASEFRLMAEGSGAPYTWSLAKGKLPAGLTLTPDGRIFGRVSAHASEGAHKITAKVTNSLGKSATKDLTINVKVRPTKWYEEGRLGALIHIPGAIKPEHYADFAHLMKLQGYCLAMPICFGNAADNLFRWSSRFDPDSPEKDVYPGLRKAFEAEGIHPGIYIGDIENTSHYTRPQVILILEDALLKCEPAAVWLDWAAESQLYPENDAWFSMMRTISPDMIVIVNAGLLSGDWDIASTEDGSYGKLSTIWDYWPDEFHATSLLMYNEWPKTVAKETWRLMDYFKAENPTAYWQEFLKCQISLICDGNIVNMDHTLSLDPKKTGYDTLLEYPQMILHKGMADWANPKGIPSLLPSYTNVNPGPLRKASWGYNTISSDRKTIYLHILKNPRGKTGMPKGSGLNIELLDTQVKSIVWMNTNKPLNFTQKEKVLTIKLAGVTADHVDTIIKINLAKPLPDTTRDRPLTAPPYKWAKAKPGNLAAYKPAKLLSLDCTHELYPSTGYATAFQGVDSDPRTIAQGAWEWAWTYHVDLEKPQEVGRIIIRFGTTYATEYSLKVSADGIDWHELGHVTGCNGDIQTYKFAPRMVRYIRVFGIKPDGENQPGGQMGIAELEAYRK
ncbi:MAG: discoidin domain-containing protein [Armatimonadota bacterium]